MSWSISHNVTSLQAFNLVEKIRICELTDDNENIRLLLKPVWEDINSDPNFSQFETPEEAELLRACGAFLMRYGRSKNLVNYQERSKNLLTKSFIIFEAEGNLEKAVEAKTLLGFTYFQEGRFNDYLAFLEDAESQCTDQVSAVFLQIQACILYAYTKINDKALIPKAIKIIEAHEFTVGLCNDQKVKIQFHTQAGMIYRQANEYEKCLKHYETAIAYAQQIRAEKFIALNLNNIGFLYLHQKQFDKAHKSVEKSLEIFRSLNESGWIPHVLDTKAMIYFDEEKLPLSLKTIEKAIFYFRQGEDYAGFCDALWNQTKILFALNRNFEALENFISLYDLATQKLDDTSVKKYLQLLADLIYIPVGKNFEEKVINYQRHLIKPVQESSKTKTEAARKLGFDSRHNYANLLARIGLNESSRKTRADKSPIFQVKFKGEIVLPDSTLTYNNASFGFFVCPGMAFEKAEELVLLVNQTKHLKKDDFVLMSENEIFIAQLEVTRNGLQFVGDTGIIANKNAKFIGKICGLAPASELKSNRIIFQEFADKYFEDYED